MSGVEKIRKLNPGGIKYSSVGKLVPIPCEVCQLQNLIYVKLDWKLKKCIANIDDGDREGGKGWHIELFILCGLLVIVGIILVL